MRKLACIFSIISMSCLAQDGLTAYTHDYEFTEGVFLTADQFKQNNPLSKLSIISSVPKNEIDFIKEAAEQKYFTYKDSSGKEQKVESAALWGYSQNRSVYINFNKTFNRLNVIGTLCHFTAVIRTSVGFFDPMTVGGMGNTVDELRQFLFDTKTTKIYDFNSKNMEMLLKNDPGLYTAFMAMSKRKKDD